MARIRSIKPEFWDSEDTANASLRARLLYIAMWNMADDYGIGDAAPIRLLSFAFPHDDLEVSDIPPLCGEIADRFGVVFYRHESRAYYFISNFDKHQRTEKKAKQRTPYPHDLKSPAIPAFMENVSDIPTPSDGSTVTGRRKKEEGTGEQGNNPLPVPVKAAPAKATAEPESFADFWDAYGKKTGRPKSLTAFKAALKKPGVTSEVLIEAASEYVEWAKVEGKFPDFTKDPATWLRGEHWNDERSARERAKPRTKLDGFADVDAELAADEEGYSEVRRIGGAR